MFETLEFGKLDIVSCFGIRASNFLVRSTSSIGLFANSFRFYFMGPSGLLFTFPSRY